MYIVQDVLNIQIGMKRTLARAVTKEKSMKLSPLMYVPLMALMIPASAVAEQSRIYSPKDQRSNSVITLDLVRSAEPAQVELYTRRSGLTGALLGTAPVHAGANNDVRVAMSRDPLGSVLAVIVNREGTILDREIIEFAR